ncbi:hypothetical protein GGR54DRAFT_583859 [Hypoxylon sp. NC1633]|nr:hypothetical protein GGR54DRAFT_583859 [Hypoxylon sp. NC1633]
MESSAKHTTNWWAIIHTLAILGQIIVFAVGVTTFVFSRPTEFGEQFSTEEFWDNQSRNVVLPWIAGGVGTFTTLLNSVTFVVLWKANKAVQLLQIASRVKTFGDAVIGCSVVIGLVVVADIAIAVKAGLSGQAGICATASIGSVLSITAILADHLKLRKVRSEQRKYSYTLELGQVSEEDTSMPTAAPPPPYETAVASGK